MMPLAVIVGILKERELLFPLINLNEIVLVCYSDVQSLLIQLGGGMSHPPVDCYLSNKPGWDGGGSPVHF
eukprot:scaffold219471_cov58-Attheya_sp.AAC.3